VSDPASIESRRSNYRSRVTLRSSIPS